MDPDTLAVWSLTRRGPWRWRMRMRAGLVLYVLGLQQLGVVVSGVPRMKPSESSGTPIETTAKP